MSIDLKTRYMGIELKNPLIAGPTPWTGRIELLKTMEEAGVAAVTLPSLFEEQIEHEALETSRLHQQAGGMAEADDFFPELQNYNAGPDSYLETLRTAKAELSIPVFGSLNGHTPGGWVHYARQMQEAGADAIELNIYDVPTDPKLTAQQVEDRYLLLISSIKAALQIPLAVKVGPFFTSLPQMAQRIKQAGATGLIVFNRFVQPDINLEDLEVEPMLELSTSAELRLPLRWIAILKGRVELSLGATTGVHTVVDVIKLLLAGADATYLASAILKNGAEYPKLLLDGLSRWMESREYESVEQLKGSMSQLNSPNPEEYERANYMRALARFTSKLR